MIRLFTFLLLAILSFPGFGANPYGGVCAIWYGSNYSTLDLDHVDCGQVVVNWKEIQTAENTYSWTALDNRMAEVASRGLKTTIQVNGNDKPNFLFTKVPYCPTKLSAQVYNTQGTLAYWHTYHRTQHNNMLAALAAHIAGSAYAANIIGIRLNYNKVGTEHSINGTADCTAGWITPSGVTFQPFSQASGYNTEVENVYFNNFPPTYKVMVRHDDGYSNSIQTALNQGTSGVYQTGAEMEPRYTSDEGWRYQPFIDNCRNGGATDCYAELWADSEGVRGGGVDPRPYGFEQFNYWTILSNLNVGATWLAIYRTDIERYTNPDYLKAFEFGRKYAGYHNKPTESPGAWIAFRRGFKLQGDYTFLASKSVDSATWQEVDYKDDGTGELGSQTSPYSAWAKKLSAGANVNLTFDSSFVNSTSGEDRDMTIRYLDKGTGTLTVTAFGDTEVIGPLENTNNWIDRSYTIIGGNNSNVVNLAAAGSAVTVHMVEIERTGTGTPTVPDTVFEEFNKGNPLEPNDYPVFFKTAAGTDTNGIIDLRVSDGTHVASATACNSNATGGRCAFDDLATLTPGPITVELDYDNPDYDSDVHEDGLLGWAKSNVTTAAYSGSTDEKFGTVNGITITNSTAASGLAVIHSSNAIAAVVNDVLIGRFQFKDDGTTVYPKASIGRVSNSNQVGYSGTYGAMTRYASSTGDTYASREWAKDGFKWIEIQFRVTADDTYVNKAGPVTTVSGDKIILLKSTLWKNRTPTTISRASTFSRPDTVTPVPYNCSVESSLSGTQVNAECYLSETNGTVYNVTIEAESTPTTPNASQVIAGTDSSDVHVAHSSYVDVTGSTASFTYTGVNPYTNKYSYNVHVDLVGHVSAVVPADNHVEGEAQTTIKKIKFSDTNTRLRKRDGTVFNDTLDFFTLHPTDPRLPGPKTDLVYIDNPSIPAGVIDFDETDVQCGTCSGSINALTAGTYWYSARSTDGTVKSVNTISVVVE
ncbi:MAG: hypothetical protein IPN62_16415 [Flavobacteriales bacterium]|nr:hypothetical protein [Flavobacteriales bacterium]